jgi:hypothetical protein
VALRHPHSLTSGMRKRQHSLAGFAEFIDWINFKRSSLNHSIILNNEHLIPFTCGDENQVIIWLLRNKLTATQKESFKMNFSREKSMRFFFTTPPQEKKIKEIITDNIHLECPLPSFEKDLAIYLHRI